VQAKSRGVEGLSQDGVAQVRGSGRCERGCVRECQKVFRPNHFFFFFVFFFFFFLFSWLNQKEKERRELLKKEEL
jgi:hypothetical protein